MLKNNSGFSLAESMVSLLILLIAFRFLLPTLTHIEIENHVLAEHEAALTLLHNSLIEWAAGRVTIDHRLYQGTDYKFEWRQSDQSATLCVKWIVSSHRLGKECGELKK